MYYMNSLCTPGTLAQVAQVLTLADALCLAAAGCLKGLKRDEISWWNDKVDDFDCSICPSMSKVEDTSGLPFFRVWQLDKVAKDGLAVVQNVVCQVKVMSFRPVKVFSFSGDVAPLPVNLWCRCRRYVVIGRLFSETTRSSWCFEGSCRLPSKGSEIWKDDESIAKATDWQGNVNATCWKPCHTACALGCSLSAKCAYIEVYFEAWTGIKCAICPAGVHCKWDGSRTHT